MTDRDTLHLITGPGYYGGHPNPTRANLANTFNAPDPQSPVSPANPVECDYRRRAATGPGRAGALATFADSTNGLAEYTASNFGGAMKGDLLAAGFDATPSTASSSTRQATAIVVRARAVHAASAAARST